jgi:hypothetical protein
VNENQNNKLDEIDLMIKNIIAKYISKVKIDPNQPLSLNVLFDEEYEEEIEEEDLEFFYEDDKSLTLTLYVPYSINELRFNVISDKKLIVRSCDYSFYKQFWFAKSFVKETIKPTYKNNVLEISFLKKM